MTYRLTDPEFLRDPAPQLAQMRAAGPLVAARLPLVGRLWVTTTDAAARRVLKDTTRFARDSRRATGKPMDRQFWWAPRSIRPLMQNLVVRDGADHKRLRGLVDHAFARVEVTKMADGIGQKADQLLAGLRLTHPVDLSRTYSRPLPFAVICQLLGIPEEKRAHYANGVAPISSVSNMLHTLWALLRINPIMADMRAEFRALRQQPKDGLISELVHAEMEGDRLSEDELLAMVFTLFVAGHETTVHLINGLILQILTTPDLRALVSDRDTPPLLIEEVMRHLTPITLSKLHFVLEDTEFDGVRLKKGDKVAAFLLAANHDPDRHAAPEDFTADRKPNAHLGFGHGPHVCLGMSLARQEAAIAATRLFQTFPKVELHGPPPDMTQRVGIRAPRQVMVNLGTAAH